MRILTAVIVVLFSIGWLSAVERVSEGNIEVTISARQLQVAELLEQVVRIPRKLYREYQLESNEAESEEGEEGIPHWRASRWRTRTLPDAFELRREIQYFKPGSYATPVARLRLASADAGQDETSEYSTPITDIKVASLLGEKQGVSDPESYGVASMTMNYTRLIILLLGFLLGGVALFFLVRRLRARIAEKEAVVEEEASMTAMQAWEEFRQQMNLLAVKYKTEPRMEPLAAKQQQLFLAFLNHLFDFDALNYTSNELTRKLRQRECLGDNDEQILRKLMADWLLYKYARSRPTPAHMQEAHESLRVLASHLYDAAREAHVFA